ncbi:MAG: RNase A-like domain-containing protein, partial [Pseudomonadota bacterium]
YMRGYGFDANGRVTILGDKTAAVPLVIPAFIALSIEEVAAIGVLAAASVANYNFEQIRQDIADYYDSFASDSDAAGKHTETIVDGMNNAVSAGGAMPPSQQPDDDDDKDKSGKDKNNNKGGNDLKSRNPSVNSRMQDKIIKNGAKEIAEAFENNVKKYYDNDDLQSQEFKGDLAKIEESSLKTQKYLENFSSEDQEKFYNAINELLTSTVDDHEGSAHGGHLKAKHVEQFKQYLLDRFDKQPYLQATRSYLDAEKAELSYKEISLKRLDEIAEWYFNEGVDGERRRISDSIKYDRGYVLRRDRLTLDTSKEATVVYQRVSDKIKIVTSFID